MPGSIRKAMLTVWAVVAVAAPSWAQEPSEIPYQSSEPMKPVPAPLAAGANSFAQGQARALIESKGFSQVSSLVNGSDGIWRGTASKDGRKVDVSIDFQGRVAAQ